MQSTGSAAWKATSFPGSVTGSSTRLVRATCADALRPIWLTKTVTACRTRQRMQPSCSGCGHTVTSRRILSWQSTTPSKTVDPSDTPTGNAVAPGAAIRRDSPCPAHTGSNEMPGSRCTVSPNCDMPQDSTSCRVPAPSKENCFRCEVNAGMGAALDGKVDDVTNPMSTEGLADPAGGDNAHANAGAALRRYRRQAVHQSKALTRALADCGSVSGTSAPAKAAPQWRAARSPDAHLTSEYSRVPENNTSSIDAERSSVVICRGPDARTLVTRPRLAQPVPMGTSTSRNAPNATTPLPAS